MSSRKNASHMMSVHQYSLLLGKDSCVLQSAHVTETKHREWRVYTSPEFRKYYETECHNSVESEQLELRYRG